MIYHTLLNLFTLAFAGFTLATHMCVLLGANLTQLFFVAPIFILTFLVIAYSLSKQQFKQTANSTDCSSNELEPLFSSILPSWIIMKFDIYRHLIFLISLAVAFFFSTQNWLLFWIFLSLIMLLSYLFSSYNIGTYVKDNRYVKASFNENNKSNEILLREHLIVLFFSLAGSFFSYFSQRSDLDDSYYVSIAAYANTNPYVPLLSIDPILDIKGILFPSYKFTSYEIMCGSLAHIFNVSSATIMYQVMPSLFGFLSVVTIFVFMYKFRIKGWLITAVVAFFLIMLLGETHREQGNFSLFRIFQGKAILVSLYIPLLMINIKDVFEKLSNINLFKLFCSFIAVIGISNFGMVIGPMVTSITALAIFLTNYKKYKKSFFLVMLISTIVFLSYLVIVLFQSKNSNMSFGPVEHPSLVWIRNFGTHQQYLVIFLLLSFIFYPFQSRRNNLMFLFPWIILFVILLNPILSNFISLKLTTPPVYWRVVWTIPLIMMAAIFHGSLFEMIFNLNRQIIFKIIIIIIYFTLIAYSAPYNTLRKENLTWNTSGIKADPKAWYISNQIISKISREKYLLAPSFVSAVMPRLENRPRLIFGRLDYLITFQYHFSEKEYNDRYFLARFIDQKNKHFTDIELKSLKNLRVDTILLDMNEVSFENDKVKFEFNKMYQQIDSIDDFSLFLAKKDLE